MHTSTRRLDYHPHAHFVVPAAALDAERKRWRTKRRRKGNGGTSGYLFNHKALTKVFRAKMPAALDLAGLTLPCRTPKPWVVDCKSVGNGTSAIIYLGRYLYRSVIQEKNIVACSAGQVTFRYRDAKTGTSEYRTVPGAQFLWLVLRHVLPKGFRRARNFGFPHPNCKRLIALLQVLLRFVPVLASDWVKPRAPILCVCCGAVMKIVRTRIAASIIGDPATPLAVGGACRSCERRAIDGSPDVSVHELRARLAGGWRGSMRDCRIPAWLAAMVSVARAIGRIFTSENGFSDRIPRMYFLQRSTLRGASTGLVQQSG